MALPSSGRKSVGGARLLRFCGVCGHLPMMFVQTLPPMAPKPSFVVDLLRPRHEAEGRQMPRMKRKVVPLLAAVQSELDIFRRRAPCLVG